MRVPDCTPEDVFIPNTFSPNGDNFNDVFKVESNFVEELELLIFNRWGELVFETTDINSGWDGTFDGEVLSPGVYAYIINVTCVNKLNFSANGNVSLMK